ncbi:porin [Flavobacteriaceae bacterium 14752]|uniref:porin n=1 Tax=Mesohalobacter salilacus TaxID=2491711 RepID=UPI000F64274D|nr:porin [Flavobacteriaceae bacterium 14752]
MKVFKIIVTVIVIMGFLESFAQNTRLSSYNFGEGYSFTNSNGSTMKIEGYIQPYFDSEIYEGSDQSSGDRFRMRRLRVRLSGKSANERFGYRFQVDLAGADEAERDINSFLLDAYISYKIARRIEFIFGQRATYTDNRELFMNSYSLQLPERSRLTSAFASIREFGFFAKGSFRTGRGTYLKPYITVTNGDGANAFTNDRGGLKYGARLDFLPFGLFTNFGQFRQADVVRELTPKLVVGATINYNDGISSRRGRNSGRIFYLNDINGNGMLDDGEERLPDYGKFGIDFMFKYKGFSVIGEYHKSFADIPNDINLRNDIFGDDINVLTDRFRGRVSPTSDEFRDFTPQEYARRQMMLGEAYNIQGGYLFKNGFSVDARYTHINADRFSFLNNATFYNRPDYYTIGVSKYLNRSYGAKIQASYTWVNAGEDGINDNQGEKLPGDEQIFRLILTLAF